VQREKEGLKKSLRTVSIIGSFGFVMGACIFVGYYLGSYVDKKFGTAPWFMLLFLILFMVGAFIKFIQSIKEAEK